MTIWREPAVLLLAAVLAIDVLALARFLISGVRRRWVF